MDRDNAIRIARQYKEPFLTISILLRCIYMGRTVKALSARIVILTLLWLYPKWWATGLPMCHYYGRQAE